MKKKLLAGLGIIAICALLMFDSYAHAALVNVNLLSNSGFEDGLSNWTTDHGTLRSSDPTPHSGDYYLMGARDGSPTSYTSQTVDLLANEFTATELDSGIFAVNYGGWQAGWLTQTDSGKIEIVLRDAGLSVLESHDLGWFYSNNSWTLLKGEVVLDQGTRYIEYGFYSQRFQGTNSDGFLDDAFVTINPVPIPATALLLGSGIVGLAGVRIRRKRK